MVEKESFSSVEEEAVKEKVIDTFTFSALQVFSSLANWLNVFFFLCDK